MNHSAWESILNHLCEKEELECEFGIGRRIVDRNSIDAPSNMRIVLNVYLNTMSSMRIATTLYEGFTYLSKAIQDPETNKWERVIPYGAADGEVFILESVYMKSEDALIGWDINGDVPIIIPWENISSIKKNLPFNFDI